MGLTGLCLSAVACLVMHVRFYLFSTFSIFDVLDIHCPVCFKQIMFGLYSGRVLWQSSTLDGCHL